MGFVEHGVLSESTKYFFTPSDLARNLFFYITRCGHYFCDNAYAFSGTSDVGKLSARRTFLLFYVRSGTMELRLDGSLYKASSDHAVLIDCRRPHEYRALNDTEFIWIHFDGANSHEFYKQIVQLRGKVFPVRDGGNLYYAASELVQDSGRTGGLSEIARSQHLYAILCQLLIPHMAGDTRAISPVAQAMEFIRLHLGERITIGQLAGYVGLSPSHFTRLFRNATALSPYEYILLQRLDRAKLLLLTTSFAVKEIAYAVGYTNETSFTAAFTQKVGTSPRAYRKLVNFIDL